jgi:hypothetical protein
MKHPGFGHLWQQAEMPDVQIQIYVVHDADSSGDNDPKA